MFILAILAWFCEKSKFLVSCQNASQNWIFASNEWIINQGDAKVIWYAARDLTTTKVPSRLFFLAEKSFLKKFVAEKKMMLREEKMILSSFLLNLAKMKLITLGYLMPFLCSFIIQWLLLGEVIFWAINEIKHFIG